MKVIESISDTNIGGAGRLLLTRLAKSNREEIETVVILPKGSALTQHLKEQNIDVYEIEGCADRSFDIKAVREIMKIIKKLQVDLVNCHGCMSARVAAMLCGVPIRIYTRHCAYEVPWLMRLPIVKQILGGIGVLLSQRAIAVAYAAKKDLMNMGYPEERITVIINGVEGLKKYDHSERNKIRRELGVEGKFVVGICARVERCKDHESFLRAARILLRENDKYRFVIVGDGSLMTQMRELACALGISDKVIFTGFTDDVERYFNCFDLNVNCSIGTETSSLALSEGMSIGLPAVASSYGGNPYMVRHGENGLIYTMGDFCELANMIRLLANDTSMYERMSRAAYDRYKTELNSSKMAAETESFYQALYQEYVGETQTLVE